MREGNEATQTLSLSTVLLLATSDWACSSEEMGEAVRCSIILDTVLSGGLVWPGLDDLNPSVSSL